MKQIFDNRGKIIAEEVPIPLCEDNGVIVKNICSLISSGTDSQYIKGRAGGMIGLVKKNPALVKQAFDKIKREGLSKTLTSINMQMSELKPLGYSSSGIVVEAGKNVSEFVPGDKVACGGAGYANHAEYIYVPKNLVIKIPDGLEFEEASFATIGAIAMQGVRRLQAQIGETVIVIGLGLIGLLTGQILRAAGCKVIGMDINNRRCELAKELGLINVFNSSKTNLWPEVDKLTIGRGADGVIVTAATRSSLPVQQAVQMCRKKGRVIVVGHVGLTLDRSLMYHKEIDFGLSCAYGPGRYDPEFEEKGKKYPEAYVRWTATENMKSFLDLASQGKINVRKLIGQERSVCECNAAYEEVMSGRAITNIFRYVQEQAVPRTRKVIAYRQKPIHGKINIGIIGAGRIIKEVHLPNISRIDKYNVYAIASRTPQNAQNVAKHYKASYYTTDYKDILADKNCDAVLIATRNNLHAQMAIDAAKAGKAIYLEKPMATNESDLDKLAKVLKETKVPFMVGFNRRYSPFVQAIRKKLTTNASGPWMMNYVANFGKFNASAFVHDLVEGGERIISECCHYFDLANYFTNSNVKNITCMPASKLNPEENFAATIKYEDGSLANFFCSATGNVAYPKEKFVVFRDNNVAEVYNYKTMKLNNKVHSLKREDKGHIRALFAFYNVIKSQQYDLGPYITATEVSIRLSVNLRKDFINRTQNI